MSLISVEHALSILTKDITPLASENVPLQQAYDRVLAENLQAKVTQPPFDGSAMDGYALRFRDLQEGVRTFSIIGEAAAGHGFMGSVKGSQAVRIFTGAPVPNGADTIIIQEDTQVHNNQLSILDSARIEQGFHIRPKGQDFKKGEIGLTAGKTLNARDLLLAASMNYAELPVFIKPKVAVLATGDELVSPGHTPNPDQIISSVPYGLIPMIQYFQADALHLGIARDTLDSLEHHLCNASDADILVTIGGASVGDHDLVQKVLKQLGIELNFWKIAMRPGKPLMSGTLGKTHVLGLPGNPVSAMICARIFLVAIIKQMLGQSQTPPETFQAVLSDDLPENGSRQHYMRAHISQAADGTYKAKAIKSQDSSLQKAFSSASGLIIRSPRESAALAGSRVPFIWLDF